jgi:hypothetical protein
MRKGFLIAEIPSIEGFPSKRPETTTSCGLKKSHPSRDSHRKGLRQQQVVAQKNPIHEGIPIGKFA